MDFKRLTVVAGVLILAVALIAGCSRDNPTQPSAGMAVAYSAVQVTGEEQFMAKVQTRDEAQRTLTFYGRPEVVVAYQNCEIVRLQHNQDAPSNFEAIQSGDSVQVFGERVENNYVYAYRLRVSPKSPDGYQYAARVQTTDQNQLMIAFKGRPDIVIAEQHCEYARQCLGFQFGAEFSDIKPGDSVHAFGEKHQDGYIYAYRIRTCVSDPAGRWDVGFKDTIATIDYANLTFTVNNRTELIQVDENTKLRTVIVVHNEPQGRESGGGAALGNGDGNATLETIDFTDLQAGDVVSVHAVFVDETTLLAKSVTLVDCEQPEKKCVEFTDVLASVDVPTRTVTFEDQAWTGVVCNGAKLIGLDGELLALEDFAAGETVAVKGFPVDENTLQICKMEKVPAL